MSQQGKEKGLRRGVRGSWLVWISLCKQTSIRTRTPKKRKKEKNRSEKFKAPFLSLKPNREMRAAILEGEYKFEHSKGLAQGCVKNCDTASQMSAQGGALGQG